MAGPQGQGSNATQAGCLLADFFIARLAEWHFETIFLLLWEKPRCIGLRCHCGVFGCVPLGSLPSWPPHCSAFWSLFIWRADYVLARLIRQRFGWVAAARAAMRG